MICYIFISSSCKVLKMISFQQGFGLFTTNQHLIFKLNIVEFEFIFHIFLSLGFQWFSGGGLFLLFSSQLTQTLLSRRRSSMLRLEWVLHQFCPHCHFWWMVLIFKFLCASHDCYLHFHFFVVVFLEWKGTRSLREEEQ